MIPPRIATARPAGPSPLLMALGVVVLLVVGLLVWGVASMGTPPAQQSQSVNVPIAY